MQSVRGLCDRTVTLAAPIETLRTLRAQVDALSAALSPHCGSRPLPLWAPPRADDLGAMLPYTSVCGRLNPQAPPVEMSVEGDGVVGRVRFTDAYEGPPRAVHGGWVAAVHDQVLALAAFQRGFGGPTASLTIQYRSMTPIHQDVSFVARVERTEGRKAWVTGASHAGDTLLSEAEALFIRRPPR